MEGGTCDVKLHYDVCCTEEMSSGDEKSLYNRLALQYPNPEVVGKGTSGGIFSFWDPRVSQVGVITE